MRSTLDASERQHRESRGPTVVVVDDNPDDRLMVARILRRELPAVKVVEVSSPVSLSDVLEQGRFDALVTDYDLRWSNGLKVLRDVRARWPDRPVLMFTGTGTEEIAVEAMKSGLDDYVIKTPNHLVRLAGSLRLALRRRRERDRAREVAGRLRRLFAAVPLGLYRSTLEGTLIEANPALATILGEHDASALVGQRLDSYLPDGDGKRRHELLSEAGTLRGHQYRVTRSDGSERWLEEDASIVRPTARPAYCEGCIHDVTERRRAEDSLRALHTAVEALPIGVTITDTTGRIVYANAAEASLHGYSRGELLGREARSLVSAEYARSLRPEEIAGLRSWRRERPNVRKDGSIFPAQLISDAVRDASGIPVGIVTICEDISERRAAEEQLIHSALYDPLTGLPNRLLFREQLLKAWQRARRRSGNGLGVLFLDLDHFKLVNDTFGHAAGDSLLREAARRIEGCLRPEDCVARLGGDEFAIVVEDVNDAEQASRVAERCRSAIEQPFEVAGQEVFVGASIGIAICDTTYSEPEALLRDADTAMYRAKAQGRNRAERFEPGMRRRSRLRLSLGAQLRRALDRGDIVVHYQPLVHTGSGHLRGVEALARWRHTHRGLLEAGAFVRVAEETGLITAIDALVLRRACEAVGAWNRQSRTRLAVSVNISALQFLRRDLVSSIDRTLSEANLEPGLLHVELTERTVVSDVAKSTRILARLREAGVGVSIDDFGTGQASLAYLKSFPLHGLKIDRSFVGGLGTGGPDDAIVDSVITLGHSLGLTVTAEGVETATQLESLRHGGCDLVQGYLIGRPSAELPAPSHSPEPGPAHAA